MYQSKSKLFFHTFFCLKGKYISSELCFSAAWSNITLNKNKGA